MTEKKEKKEEEKKHVKKPEPLPQEPVIARKVRRQAAADQAKEKVLLSPHSQFNPKSEP